jgi:hypothetical protein
MGGQLCRKVMLGQKWHCFEGKNRSVLNIWIKMVAFWEQWLYWLDEWNKIECINELKAYFIFQTILDLYNNNRKLPHRVKYS